MITKSTFIVVRSHVALAVVAGYFKTCCTSIFKRKINVIWNWKNITLIELIPMEDHEFMVIWPYHLTIVSVLLFYDNFISFWL